MSIMNYRPQSLQEHNIHLIQENRALREENAGLQRQVKRLGEKLKAVGADSYSGKFKTDRKMRPRPGGISG